MFEIILKPNKTVWQVTHKCCLPIFQVTCSHSDIKNICKQLLESYDKTEYVSSLYIICQTVGQVE